MPKLSDTQLVILSAAARRKDGAVLPLPRSLKVNKAAATTVLKSLLKKGLVAERLGATDEAHWRKTRDGGRRALAITDAGLQVIGVEPEQGSGKRATAAKRRPKKRGGRATRKLTTAKPKGKAPAAARQGTKQALLIDLLKRKKGAAIEEMVEATGWQAHSVRGAISGALKKKLGLMVTSMPVEGRGRVYRIAGGR